MTARQTSPRHRRSPCASALERKCARQAGLWGQLERASCAAARSNAVGTRDEALRGRSEHQQVRRGRRVGEASCAGRGVSGSRETMRWGRWEPRRTIVKTSEGRVLARCQVHDGRRWKRWSAPWSRTKLRWRLVYLGAHEASVLARAPPAAA